MSLADFFRKKSSGDVAKDRLKFVLVSDRANCSPEVMEKIKNDIIQVISKYICENPQKWEQDCYHPQNNKLEVQT